VRPVAATKNIRQEVAETAELVGGFAVGCFGDWGHAQSIRTMEVGASRGSGARSASETTPTKATIEGRARSHRSALPRSWTTLHVWPVLVPLTLWR
jgi:hypothetical protein